MKYAGSITIVDDEGNAVFQRELTDDEVVEAILAGVPDETEPDMVLAPRAGHPKGIPVFVTDALPPPAAAGVRSCCGAKAKGRHKKGCENGAPTPYAQQRMTVDNRQPFSEPTYKVVKSLLDDEDRTVDDISSEKGLDLDEVRRVNLADDFPDYLAIA